jgi:hypothetical protein
MTLRKRHKKTDEEMWRDVLGLWQACDILACPMNRGGWCKNPKYYKHFPIGGTVKTCTITMGGIVKRVEKEENGWIEELELK